MMTLSESGFVRSFQKKDFCPQPLPEMIRLDFYWQWRRDSVMVQVEAMLCVESLLNYTN
jgi:hypothetical protein